MSAGISAGFSCAFARVLQDARRSGPYGCAYARKRNQTIGSVAWRWRYEFMSAESALTAVAVVRALLNEDTKGLAVLLPDGLPESGRELIASLASLTVLSAKVAARAEGTTEGEYLDRIIRLWTDSPG